MKKLEILEGLARKAADAAVDCRTLLEVLVTLPGSRTWSELPVKLTGETLDKGADLYQKLSERWKIANGFRELPNLVTALQLEDDEDPPSVAQEQLS